MQIAAFARAKGRGFWETVDYLAKVERTLGIEAVLFELELQMQMDRAEAEALRKSAAKGGKA